MYDELPDNLKPATADEARIFSSEMLYSELSFGVHQYWRNLDPSSPRLATMFETCPEMWSILPVELLLEQERWRHMACSNLGGTGGRLVPGVNITFDPAVLCRA